MGLFMNPSYSRNQEQQDIHRMGNMDLGAFLAPFINRDPIARLGFDPDKFIGAGWGRPYTMGAQFGQDEGGRGEEQTDPSEVGDIDPDSAGIYAATGRWPKAGDMAVNLSSVNTDVDYYPPEAPLRARDSLAYQIATAIHEARHAGLDLMRDMIPDEELDEFIGSYRESNYPLTEGTKKRVPMPYPLVEEPLNRQFDYLLGEFIRTGLMSGTGSLENKIGLALMENFERLSPSKKKAYGSQSLSDLMAMEKAADRLRKLRTDL